ncbi:MAG: class I SAM-dependent methyltransferase [Lachnospiraceae bacterium]|nr:class I SAM-dependent methyltransferase [Lachnospiraceae bacterium]
MSESYTSFARVYDTFMDNVPYQEWADFLDTVLQKYGCFGKNLTANPLQDTEMEQALLSERNSVLDLGCGTGTLTELLADKGYDMIGIDNAEEMLEIAMEKRMQSGKDILYLLQDMREFELYGTVGAVISVCDSLNYILDEEDMQKVFDLVNNYLYPGGIFVFDFNTVYKYETVIGDTTIAENREDCSFIWDNYYHDEERINEYDLTIFVEEEEELFRRFSETHYQRGYTLDEMKQFVKNAGLEFVTAMDADTHEGVTDESERIYVVAREIQKERV